MPRDTAREPGYLVWIECVGEDFATAEAADVEGGGRSWDGLGYGKLERGCAVCAGRGDVRCERT